MSKNANTAEGWDEEYEAGRWAFLRSLPESGRYGIIGMWLSLTGTIDEVLDIGGGEGLLYERLAPMGLKRYVGMDISPSSLEIANVDPSVAALRAGDMHTFEPEPGETFSAIVFNEVLHFAEDPVAVVRRYLPYLQKDGVIALSMYAPNKTESGAHKLIDRLWKDTDDTSSWEVLDDYRLQSDKKGVTWRMRLVKPVI